MWEDLDIQHTGSQGNPWQESWLTETPTFPVHWTCSKSGGLFPSLLLLEQVVLGLPNVTFILFFRRHSFLSCIQNSTFNLIGRSRETYLPASHNIISLLGESPVWTTLLPALFSCSILSCNFFQRNGHPSPACLRWFCTVASPLTGLRACWARDSWDH